MSVDGSFFIGYPPSRPLLTTAFHAATLIIGHLVDGCAYIVRIHGDGIAAPPSITFVFYPNIGSTIRPILGVAQHSMLVFSYNKRSARKRFSLMSPPHLEESELLRCIVLLDGFALDDNRRVTSLDAA